MDATGFNDKNGRLIMVDDTIRYPVKAQIGVRFRGRGSSTTTEPIYQDRLVVGVVTFGLQKYYFDYIQTYYIATDEQTEYDDYDTSGRRGDYRKLHRTENLSVILTDRLAGKSEVINEQRR